MEQTRGITRTFMGLERFFHPSPTAGTACAWWAVSQLLGLSPCQIHTLKSSRFLRARSGTTYPCGDAASVSSQTSGGSALNALSLASSCVFSQHAVAGGFIFCYSSKDDAVAVTGSLPFQFSSRAFVLDCHEFFEWSARNWKCFQKVERRGMVVLP